MAIGSDGRPVIAYADAGIGALRIALCDDAACTSATIGVADAAGLGAEDMSLRIGVDDNPIVVYRTGDPANDLRVTACHDRRCSDSTSTTLLEDGSDVYDPSLVIGADGNPLISHGASIDRDVDLTLCANPSCSPTFRRGR